MRDESDREATQERRHPNRRGVLTTAAGLLGLATTPALAQPAAQPIDPRISSEAITFPVRKKTFKGQLVRLRAGPKRPGILLLPDQRGINPFFRQTARRLALDGFVVLIPDLLSVFDVAENSDEGATLVARVAPAEHLLVFDTAAGLLTHHPDCTGAVAVIGYVWGGSFALQMAMEPDRVKAVVVYYPSLPAAERMATLRVPVLFHWPEDDPRAAPVIDSVEKEMIGNGRVFEEWVYPGTQAGFASDQGTRRWDRAAADRAYDRTVFFLRRTLGAQSSG